MIALRGNERSLIVLIAGKICENACSNFKFVENYSNFFENEQNSQKIHP